MPSNKNKTTTKNGVDLNEVDVSTITLVEKDRLLDDLAKKLKSTRNFLPPDPELPAEPREPKDKSKLTFEQMLKLRVSTKELYEKVIAEQRKTDKEKRSKYLKENTYTSAGKRHGAQIDEVASEIHTYNKKDLEAAHKKVSDIRESVKFTTLGKEQGVLTDATVKLQNSIQQEIKKRSTTMGKIGEFMSKQNIDAVSIISGLAGHSPIVGLATKYILDKVRENRDAKAKEKAKKYQVGDLHEKLPRSDEPQIDNDSDVKLDYETAERHISKHKDEHTRHAVLADLLNKKQIDAETHQKLHTKLVSPEYKAPTVVPGQPQGQQPTATSPTPEPAQAPQPAAIAPKQMLRDHLGNAVPDWQGYLKKTTKKKQRDDEAAAWLDMMGKRGKEKMQEEWEEKKKKPIQEWEKDEELFGPPTAKPTALAHLERREAERVKNKYNSPVKAMMVDAKILQTKPQIVPNPQSPQVVKPSSQQKAATFSAMAKAAMPEQKVSAQRIDVDPEETKLHPEVNPTEESILSLLKLMETTEKDQDKKLDTLADEKKGPFSKLEKLGTEQLVELQKINKQLATQIDQNELTANAKLRDTHDGGAEGGLGGIGAGLLGVENKGKGKDGEKSGGFFGNIIKGIGEGLGMVALKKALPKVLGKIPFLKKIPVIGKYFKGAEGATEGAGAAEGVGEAATGAGKGINMTKGADGSWAKAAGEGEGAAAGAEGGAAGAGKAVGESGGFFSKLFSKIPGLGKGAGEGAAGAGAAAEGAESGIASGVGSAMGGIGKILGAVGKTAVIGIDAFKGIGALKKGDYKGAAGYAGDAGGAIAGGSLGAEIGAGIGVLGGPFAEITVPAMSLLGGAVGGWLGGKFGKKGAETVMEAVAPKAKEDLKQVADKEEKKVAPSTPGAETSPGGPLPNTSPISSSPKAPTSPTPIKSHQVKTGAAPVSRSASPVTIKSTPPPTSPSAMVTQNPWNRDTSALNTGKHDLPKGALGTGLGMPRSSTPTPVSKPESQGGIFGTGIGSGLMSAASSAIGSVGSALSSAGSAIGGFFGLGGGDKGEARRGKPDDSLGGSKSEYARLGSMSAQGESGGDAGVTNFDRDGGKYATQSDRGGRSYGLYQITTGNKNMGATGIKKMNSTMVPYLRFLEKNNPDIAKKLNAAGGLEAAYNGDPEFVKTWKELAKNDPKFTDSQHEFIGQNAYEPLKKDLNAKGLNLDNRSETVKKMMFEAGVGGVGNATGDFEKAFRGMKPEEISKLSDSDIISKFQSVRGSRYTDPRVGERFEKEKQKMLAELGGGRGGSDQKKEEPKRVADSKAPEKVPASPSPMAAMLTQNPLSSIGDSIVSGIQSVGSAFGITPMKASLEPPPKLSTNSPGFQLAQASSTNSDLNRGVGQQKAAGGNVINAPTTNNNSNTTQVMDLRAKNTDTSYERNQNAMFIGT